MNRIRGGSGPRESPEKRCRKLRSRQYGLIRRDQALEAGMTPRQIEHKAETGEWSRVSTGIYFDVSATPSWEQSVLAAVFRGGPGAVASGRCAAALWKMPGFPRSDIEITSPRRLRGVPFIAHCGLVPEDQMGRVGPIAVTDATRTMLDLGGSAPHLVEDALDDALRRGMTSLGRLRWALHRIDGKGTGRT